MYYRLFNFDFLNPHLKSLKEQYLYNGFLTLDQIKPLINVSVKGLSYPEKIYLEYFTESLKKKEVSVLQNFILSLLKSEKGIGIHTELFLNIDPTDIASIMIASEKFAYIIIGEFALYQKKLFTYFAMEIKKIGKGVDIPNLFANIPNKEEQMIKTLISSYVMALVRFSPFRKMIQEQFEKEKKRQFEILNKSENKIVELVEQVKELEKEISFTQDPPKVLEYIEEKEKVITELEKEKSIIEIIEPKQKLELKNLLILGSVLGFLLGGV